MTGGLKMLISLRDKKQKLVIKDVLDIDFDMSVEEEDNRFIVKINRSYKLSEDFLTRAIAEEKMLQLADVRNNLEEELKNY